MKRIRSGLKCLLLSSIILSTSQIFAGEELLKKVVIHTLNLTPPIPGENPQLTQIRGYGQSERDEMFSELGLAEFDTARIHQLEEFAYSRGAFCKHDKPRFNKLGEKLIKLIYSLTTDEQKRVKLFTYANRLGRIARSYSQL